MAEQSHATARRWPQFRRYAIGAEDWDVIELYAGPKGARVRAKRVEDRCRRWFDVAYFLTVAEPLDV
jgi:hypothetical protein